MSGDYPTAPEPTIAPTAWVATGAVVVGDVTIGEHASVWYGCLLRGDIAPIVIGESTNIQDLTTVHVDVDRPTIIGARVGVGHRAIVHGCVVEDDCLIGMGAVVLSHATIGEGSVIAAGAVVLTCAAVSGIERGVVARAEPRPMRFRDGLAEVWAERHARNFTIFVFLSMTAYFMQELILEPYAGLVFGFTPGQSTSLAGAQNGGVFIGMVLVGVMATGLRIGWVNSPTSSWLTASAKNAGTLFRSRQPMEPPSSASWPS